jgi:hypothetical protein
MLKLIMKKSKPKKAGSVKLFSESDAKLEHFRKQILKHLESLEENETLNKARGMSIGTVREWKGKKYIKTGEGKWKPKYDGETRGAKMAISAIKKKIATAKDVREMMQIVLENRDRFSDKDGHPLPFVQELSSYVGEKGSALESVDAKRAENERLRKKFGNMAEPMDIVLFNKENFNKLFPDGKVETPLGEVKIGENQYEKLKEKGRQRLLGALKQVLSDPLLVYASDGVKVYTKPLVDEGKPKTIVSVTIDRDGKKISISTYQKDLSSILGKIEKSNILYEKDIALKDGRAHAPKERDNISAETTPNTGSNDGSLKTGDQDHPGKESSKSPKKSTGTEAIRETYQSAKSIEGDEDEIVIGKETITGKWKLVEADTPTASHNETTFRKTDGFPTNEDGSTINDRDYERDKSAQEAVLEIAADYDMQALSLDSPVVVTRDGIVISGNNRTMSSKIAARKGTDKKYIEALERRAKKFGLTAEQVGQFKNPRVIFEIDENKGYNTQQFAKFNESGKKAMNPIEAAVKVSKTINPRTVESIAGKISEFDTLGELYADKKAVNEIFSTLQQGGIIGQFDRPQYVTEDGITGAGKEFMETVLIGAVINEQNIRGLNREGCKSIRQKLVRAITPLIENKGMDGYSIIEELNKAVDIAMQVAINKDKFSNVMEYAKQQNMFEDNDKVAVELAKRIEGTQKDFAEFMQTMNGGLKYAANGEADIFLGKVENKSDILTRILNVEVIKKAIDGALRFFHDLKNGKGSFEKEKVVLNCGEEPVEEYRWIAKSGFVEGEHPRDGKGRFSRKNENKQKSAVKKLNTTELKGFIKESQEDRHSPNRRVIIGEVNNDARKRIEDISGKTVKNINIDSESIRHSLKKPEHNLEPEDLLLAVDVINTATDIKLSDKKHLQSDVLTFKKDIDGEITFLTEVRARKNYLLVFNAWRQKKARSRRCSNADQSPQGTYVQNESTHDELSTVSNEKGGKSSTDVKKSIITFPQNINVIGYYNASKKN